MRDGWEQANGLDPLQPDADGDRDQDTYNNKLELPYGSKSNDPTSVPDLRVGVLRAVRIGFATQIGRAHV